ncbi:PrgH/EprH family type III secretion apparatus protein [Pseudomonas agarici]|uniref:PrgH/EprH family type III secretion apparatus protein n=1 Tax=Pseudomonas agarici TaxID=46677 RepID=UPI0009E7423E|nr:PrgH/EprH family type III secretion apparatus protein [Pseudomonas agarici]
MPDNPFLPCVLRIGSGLLQGCEFTLRSSRTLFIVGTPDRLGDDGLVAAIPQDAIFVPLERGHCNFEVLLGQEYATLRILGDEVEEREVAFQRCEQIAGLHITLRPEHEPWAPELFTSTATVEPMAAGHTVRPLLRKVIVTAVVCVLLAACAAVWSVPMKSSRPDVLSLTAGTHGATRVVQGRDDRVYVFVTSERDAGWSRQVLVRHGIPSQVLAVTDERRRLESRLLEQVPALRVQRIDLSQPASPRVFYSLRRGAPDAGLEQQVSQLLHEEAAYVRQVSFEPQDDDLLVALAEQGLQRLALAFERVGQGDATVFNIAGDLQDAQRQMTRDFVDDFYRRWGDRQVRFNIDLRDDLFKGRSFQSGPQGYIKTSSSSWHFSTIRQTR